jgi:hypothetical protein
MPAGRRAIANTGDEAQMRAELAAAAAGILEAVDRRVSVVTDDEREHILAAADVVTLARTGVDYDFRGDVIDAHAPEMPTRFAKQLTQVLRGALAIGMDRHDALRLAVRCARDSMPPLRLAILDDVALHPHSRPVDVRRRLAKPWSTVDAAVAVAAHAGRADLRRGRVGERKDGLALLRDCRHRPIRSEHHQKSYQLGCRGTEDKYRYQQSGDAPTRRGGCEARGG